MRKIFKKSLSLILSIAIIFSLIILPIGAEGYLWTGEPAEVGLEIQNETVYSWGDEIKFEITIKNNLGTRITNVNIVSEPKGTAKFFQKSDSSSSEIEFITPGATRKVELIYSTTEISSFQSFFRAIATFFKRIFSWFGRDYAYTEKIKVGMSNIIFGIDVDYSTSQEVLSGGVNLDDPDPDVEIYSFKTDIEDILVGRTELVTFTAEVFENTNQENIQIKVKDENSSIIAHLKDDGVYPDECCNDGFYTGSVQLHSDERKIVNYYATYDDNVSNNVEICFYTEISDSEYDDVTALVNTISNMNDAQQVVQLLADSNIIESYSYNEQRNTVSYTAKCGISGIWTTFDSDTKGSKEDKLLCQKSGEKNLPLSTSNNSASVENKNVLVVRPYIGSDDRFTQVSKETGNKVATALGGTCTIVDNENVNLSQMSKVNNYGTVIVDSHGMLFNDTDPYIIIGQDINNRNGTTSAGFQRDYYIMIDNRFAVGGTFFEQYLGECEDTIFYLGCCYSMHNKTISDSLIKQGAKAVYGFTEPVGFTYCDDRLKEVFYSLVDEEETVYNSYIYAGKSTNFTYCTNCKFVYDGRDAYSYYSIGLLSGVIKNASNNSVVSNALIRVYENGQLIASTRTGSDGKYTLSVPSAYYVVKVSAGGYKTAKMAVSVRTGATTYNETFLLIKNTFNSGTINGNTINAITGQLLPNVKINIRSSWNNYEGAIIKTITSNENGYYEVALPTGWYTFECYLDGFITTYKNVLSFLVDFGAQNISLASELAENYYRVVLTWGENPSDLDSHLFGTTDDYSYHVYYSRKNGYDLDENIVANLDVDDTTSYGPETTTFYAAPNGNYEFYIDWYSGSGTWANSGGKVEVYNGAYLINTYYVPSVDNRAGSWKVFSINNGIYQSYNTMCNDIY